ncbi:hypothetical protein N0V84_003567 [Fusarium piperis]|uniref:Biotin-protein ligase N-terminal domain-containing protein n=1 Tax=Fusarium piperis TaxID=1435070 RepID=A0A9W8WH27_9HYPO|nr:hypothetical protein N0V84_003567 [Fusarium piperis]
MRTTTIAMASVVAEATACTTPPKALVYRGPASCQGCPEAVAELLESSSLKFQVSFAGPTEDIDINEQTLKGVQVYAHPGGGDDLEESWPSLKKYKKPLRDFVSSGGYYLGFCFGAYLAGDSPGFGLLPRGSNTDAETSQDNAQVTSSKDTVIEVDWTFVSGKTEKKRWMYFQEGAAITGLEEKRLRDDSSGRILARYSQNGDVAASVTRYGKGWVGLVGPHPEANDEWYSTENFTNPDGINFDIGYDFIAAALNGGKIEQS